MTSRIVLFDQFWLYKLYYKLPYGGAYATKYVEDHFYISSDNHFYKTNSEFTLISFHENNSSYYRQFFFDSVSLKFYVASNGLSRIDIFNTFCSRLDSINLDSNRPYGLNFFNDIIYASIAHSNEIIAIQNHTITKLTTVDKCSGKDNQLTSISVDSYGYLAITCHNNQLITIYDVNGNYKNTQLSTSKYPFMTSIDSKGRLIVTTENSLDIYY